MEQLETVNIQVNSRLCFLFQISSTIIVLEPLRDWLSYQE
jgi:hypothetical protein